MKAKTKDVMKLRLVFSSRSIAGLLIQFLKFACIYTPTLTDLVY